MSDQTSLVSRGRLFPLVDAKLLRDTAPGEMVTVLDGGRGSLAMVATVREPDGKQTSLLIFLRSGTDRESNIAWCQYSGDETVLSYGMTPRFQFDPSQAALQSPRQGAVPNGALLVGPSGIRLRAPEMGVNPMRRGDFDIGNGIWVVGGGQPSDVAILAWELVIPRDPTPPLVLFRYSAKP